MPPARLLLEHHERVHSPHPHARATRLQKAVDLIDARAASGRFSLPELEELGRRHAHDVFDLPTLQSRLTGTDFYSDAQFTRYGLDEGAISELRAWAQRWSDDIAERLLEDGASPDVEAAEDAGEPEDAHDTE